MSKPTSLPLFSVLIETYWNVKINAYNLIWNEWFVLIETYWNVKLSLRRWLEKKCACINRNILECKGSYKYHC